MAQKASALSTGLPVPSKVRLCPSSAGVDMSTSMNTKTDGKYTMLVSFKQPGSRKYAYQAQYRTRTRSAADGSYSAWSSWKATSSVSLSASAMAFNVGDGLPFPAGTTTLAANSEVSPTYWLTANVGLSTESDYASALKKADRTLGGIYSCIQYQARVRTYDTANYLHGSWSTSDTLSVYRRKATMHETYYRAINGGLRIDMDVLSADVGGVFNISSIKDANKRELLYAAWSRTADSNSTPYVNPSAGYKAITKTITRDRLKRNITYGETLAITGSYKSKTGILYVLKSSVRVSSKDTVLDPIEIISAFDEENGVLRVKARRTDPADSIQKCSCNLTYTYNGKRYSVAPTSAQKSFKGTEGTKKPFASFVFKGVPNVANDSKVSVTVSSSRYGAKNRTFSSKQRFGGNLFIWNNITYRGSNVTCWMDGEVTQAINGIASIRQPVGSQLPFVTIQKGRTNAITFTGTVLDNDPKYPSASRFKWEALAKKGAFIAEFVSPAGHKAKVLVESIVLSQSVNGMASLTVNMQEVR